MSQNLVSANRKNSMIDNSIFVFDTRKGFARFIRLNFSNNYSISTCTLRKNIEEYKLENYRFAFIIINDYEEMVDFLTIKKNVKYVFAGSTISEVNKLLLEMTEIVYLDLEVVKKKTIQEITASLKFFELNI